MVTVLRQAGFRVVIFTDDHQPAHVHVYGDGEAKIQLEGPNGVELIWAVGMKTSDIRKALSVVDENRAELLAQWRRFHD